MKIEEHLQDCNICEETVASLSSETVIQPPDATAQNASSSTSEHDHWASEGPKLSPLMARLHGIPGEFQQATTQSDLQSQIAVGSVIGNYELVRLIAESGMGVVYEARHRKLGSPVALKVLRPHVMRDPAAIERFHQEVAASGKLTHPNIVLARDADEVNGIHFLVMELVDGEDLSKLVKQDSPLSVANACEIIRQAAEALQHVDDNGMVHRDIKPSNLMLAKSGQVKLLDLGLAKLREDKPTENDNSITSTGQVMGTVDYMSPEQANDSRTADIRADIYSLGCTLYFLLTGKAPFRRDSRLKTMMAHTTDEPPQLPQHVPDELNAFYLQMLNKSADQRPRPPQAIAAKMAEFAAGSNLRNIAPPTASPSKATAESVPIGLTQPMEQAQSRAGSHRPIESSTKSATTEKRPVGTGPTKASAAQPTPSQSASSGRGTGIGKKLLAFAALPLAILLGVVIFVQTDKGTLEIRVADDIKE